MSRGRRKGAERVANVGNSPDPGGVAYVGNPDSGRVVHVNNTETGKFAGIGNTKSGMRKSRMRVSEAIEIIELYRRLSPDGKRRVMAEAIALANRAKAVPL